LSALAAQSQAERPLSAMFPMLDRYLREPEAERTMFRVRYCTQLLDQSQSAIRVRYITSERDVTLDTDDTGCFISLPQLADLRANPVAVASAPNEAFKVIVALEPNIPLKRSLPVADLRASIAQADAAARKAAGPLAWRAPHFDSVHFDLDTPQSAAADQAPADGVIPDVSGYAVLADGSRIPLPVRDGRVMVAPDDPSLRGAEWVELSADPLTARIGFSTPLRR
jgi:hypothetical protein